MSGYDYEKNERCKLPKLLANSPQIVCIPKEEILANIKYYLIGTILTLRHPYLNC